MTEAEGAPELQGPPEVLEAIDRFLADPSGGVLAGRPRRKLATSETVREETMTTVDTHSGTPSAYPAETEGEPAMARLWRNTEGTREGKYLVQRRDGSVPEWPYFVIAASDPAAPAALDAYAEAARSHGMDPEYVADIEELAAQFAAYRFQHGSGDPDAPRHRTDDPETIAKMRTARGA